MPAFNPAEEKASLGPTDGTEPSTVLPEEESQPVDTSTVEARLRELSSHYRRNHRDLYRQALARLHSPEAADDAVQDAYTFTAAKIKEGVEIRKLDGWLRVVVLNVTRSVQAKNRTLKNESVPLDEGLSVAGRLTPTEISDIRKRCQDIYRAVEELSPAQQSAFLLAELHGCHYREIATQIGRTEHAVRQLLSRARNQVRASIGQDLPSIAAPLAQLEADGRLRLKVHAQGLREKIAAKLARLHDTVATIVGRSAEAVSQPATAIVTGAALVGSLGALPVGGGAPADAVTPRAPAAALAPVPAPEAAGGRQDSSGNAGKRGRRAGKQLSSAPGRRAVSGKQPDHAMEVPNPNEDEGKGTRSVAKGRGAGQPNEEDTVADQAPPGEGGLQLSGSESDDDSEPSENINQPPPPPPPPPHRGECEYTEVLCEAEMELGRIDIAGPSCGMEPGETCDEGSTDDEPKRTNGNGINGGGGDQGSSGDNDGSDQGSGGDTGGGDTEGAGGGTE